MRLEGHVYCEAPECEHHAHVGVDTMEADRLPVGFLRVVEYGGSSDPEFAFCCLNCVMRWASQFPPPEVIECPFGWPEEPS